MVLSPGILHGLKGEDFLVKILTGGLQLKRWPTKWPVAEPVRPGVAWSSGDLAFACVSLQSAATAPGKGLPASAVWWLIPEVSVRVGCLVFSGLELLFVARN